jgi:3-methyl-2-oxobutanoate hydroxymethyltransferase
MPAVVGERVTAAVGVPTIGIGAGPACSGQVLVWHDLLGLSPGPLPRFVKQYAALSTVIVEALEAYVADVRSGAYPAPEQTYGMPEAERAKFAPPPALKK